MFSLVLGLWGVVVLSTFPLLQVLLCGVLSWLSPAAPCQDFVPLLWVDCCQWAWEVWGSDGGAAESLREEQDLFCLEERRLRGIDSLVLSALPRGRLAWAPHQTLLLVGSSWLTQYQL